MHLVANSEQCAERIRTLWRTRVGCDPSPRWTRRCYRLSPAGRRIFPGGRRLRSVQADRSGDRSLLGGWARDSSWSATGRMPGRLRRSAAGGNDICRQGERRRAARALRRMPGRDLSRRGGLRHRSLEAMASGKPVVAFARGGALETVSRNAGTETGVLFRNRPPRPFAAIRRMPGNARLIRRPPGPGGCDSTGRYTNGG